MAQIPQYFSPEVNLPSLQPLPDTNAGSAMGKLSQMAASETSELAKKAGAEKGAEDQAVAGTNPVAEDKGLFGFIPTDYSETYNKAAKIAFVEAKKSQLENTTLTLQQKYGNDLDQFQTQLSSFRQEFMANVPLKSQPQFDLLFQDHTLRATRAVTDTKLKQDFQQSQGTILTRFDELTNNLTNAIAGDPDAIGQSTNEYAHNASILLHSATMPTTDPKTGQTYPPVFDAATAERMHQHVMENVSRASVAAKYASLPTIEAKKYFVEEVLSKGGYRLPRMDGLNDSGSAQVPAVLAQQLANELKPKFQQEQAADDAKRFLPGGGFAGGTGGTAPAPTAGFQPVSYDPGTSGAPATASTAQQPSQVVIPATSRIAYVHNNPGNLKFAGQEGATRGEPASDGGYWAKFDTPDAGAAALGRQVSLDASRGLTLGEFITKYAPPSSNNTAEYILQAASTLKTDPNTPISTLPQVGLVNTIAHIESGSSVGQLAYARNALKYDHAGAVAALDASLGNDPARAARARQIVNEQYGTAQMAAQAALVEEQRQAAAEAKAKLAASDAAEYEALKQIFPQPPKPDPDAPLSAFGVSPKPAGPQITPAQVLDPNGPYKDLTNAKRIQMIELIKQNAKGEPLSQDSHRNVVELMQAIHAADGDPNKMKTTGPIYDRYTRGDLTNADFQFALKQFNDATTPDGEKLGARKAAFFKGVEGSIDASNPLMDKLDKTGRLQMYQLIWYTESKIDEYRRTGKNPYDLFDPSKKDYLGTPEAIEPFQKTLQESADYISKNMNRTERPPIPEVSQAPAATTPPATPPVKTGGNPPVPGAVQTPDGHWWIKDPATGKGKRVD